MNDPEPVLKARLRWVKHYEQSQNAALSCRRCGISKATLLKWWRRYQLQGEVGLHSQSRRPISCASAKSSQNTRPSS